MLRFIIRLKLNIWQSTQLVLKLAFTSGSTSKLPTSLPQTGRVATRISYASIVGIKASAFELAKLEIAWRSRTGLQFSRLPHVDVMVLANMQGNAIFANHNGAFWPISIVDGNSESGALSV